MQFDVRLCRKLIFSFDLLVFARMLLVFACMLLVFARILLVLRNQRILPFCVSVCDKRDVSSFLLFIFCIFVFHMASFTDWSIEKYYF